ncbi:hypothetical protein COT69_01200 [candidate division WWE3 bacterium CG09_land_8_20_14_0_10_39_24]|uniref:Uncharacterized protein n=2 Tax=Katanobacteria TaxID=422282 RepID=A0A2G9XDB1_UNCKA|nr:MAG: hypothetical protein AUJ94_01715 [bacterium CG2_30_40_12]OJI09141.1 MAG: hypothetical protein BK003_01180 [bacterium CG09_39_24]PIP04281.1 MAG: hypothetical protein COX53_03335 [candidate division WWE3 bacterium CG23_combo_of_CG06-09_8_20_14_all_40_14]PIS12977.1 MAG: hypothetical protein COT69_01200 [candidate division WWE3 bacterium CG09_land_8_20_14_0_10_39_24]PJE52249.1 MAG: hypothetical protein COV27_00110 [candidate division WWE3 bacterium CG10_big_fil_rev_8_21_14_0_10_39_14]
MNIPKNNLSRNSYYNCYSDLQRASKSLYLTPNSNVTITFLDHAIKLLENDKNGNVPKYCEKLLDIRKVLADKERLSQLGTARTADKILTLGILLRDSNPN